MLENNTVKSQPHINIYAQPKKELTVEKSDSNNQSDNISSSEKAESKLDWIPFIIISATVLGSIYLSE